MRTEAIWERAKRDWWAFVESPRGRVMELVSVVALSMLGVALYPDDASTMEQVAIQGSVVVGGLIAIGLLLLYIGFGVYSAPRSLLAEANQRELQRALVRPLEIECTSDDGNWRRIVVRNKNDFIVHSAYIRVSGNEGILPIGWVFNWSTLETDDVRLNVDIANGRTRVVDICQVQPVRFGDYVVQAVINRRMIEEPRKLTPWKTLPPGVHTLDIEVCGSNVPTADYKLDIVVGTADVELNVTPSAPQTSEVSCHEHSERVAE